MTTTTMTSTIERACDLLLEVQPLLKKILSSPPAANSNTFGHQANYLAQDLAAEVLAKLAGGRPAHQYAQQVVAIKMALAHAASRTAPTPPERGLLLQSITTARYNRARRGAACETRRRHRLDDEYRRLLKRAHVVEVPVGKRKRLVLKGMAACQSLARRWQRRRDSHHNLSTDASAPPPTALRTPMVPMKCGGRRQNKGHRKTGRRSANKQRGAKQQALSRRRARLQKWDDGHLQ